MYNSARMIRVGRHAYADYDIEYLSISLSLYIYIYSIGKDTYRDHRF